MLTRLFGIIGNPLAHSFSPAFFQKKFQQEAINASYEAFPIVAISELPALFDTHDALFGLNVTIPYKTSVIPYLDSMSNAAKLIGAVNCIQIKGGVRTGHNTDWIGFMQSLVPLLESHTNSALILGTGGSARAIAYSLLQLGIEYSFVSRSDDKARYTYDKLTPEIIAAYPLIINTTPQGMFPNIDTAPAIPYEALTSEHLLYDLVYNPTQTAFLAKGAARGATTKNGLEMLELQALASWQVWNADAYSSMHYPTV